MGGTAVGEISTKSTSCSAAKRSASENLNTPGSMFSPTRRTSETPRINSFILWAATFSTRGLYPLLFLIAMALLF